jgi:hypothetical protein
VRAAYLGAADDPEDDVSGDDELATTAAAHG